LVKPHYLNFSIKTGYNSRFRPEKNLLSLDGFILKVHPEGRGKG
jgi:hypothetical protein